MIALNRKATAKLALILGVATIASPLLAQEAAPDPAAAPSLEQQVQDPPQSARPRLWWYWMNGNITKDGIAKDMAWMKRVGIGGMQNFDASLMTLAALVEGGPSLNGDAGEYAALVAKLWGGDGRVDKGRVIASNDI